MDMKINEGFFESSNKVDKIAYRIWTPLDKAPKGVVQLSHGMNSYSAAYESFAEFLCENGYVVAAHDHAGHGRSVSLDGKFGVFAEKDGDVVLVSDMYSLYEIMKRKYKNLPYFLYGHSLGSFVARAFVAAYPDAVDGAVFSGSCSFLKLGFFAKRKMNSIVKKAPLEHFAEVEKLFFGDFEKKMGKGGWLTTNQERLLKNSYDPLYGRGLTALGYSDMYKLMEYISSDEWFKAVKGSLSALFISGELDPIGGYGEGIKEVAEKLNGSLNDVSTLIYKDEKHETLGSLSDGKIKNDLLLWFNEKTDAIVELRRSAYFGN